jgi:hypothetical protein
MNSSLKHLIAMQPACPPAFGGSTAKHLFVIARPFRVVAISQDEHNDFQSISRKWPTFLL